MHERGGEALVGLCPARVAGGVHTDGFEAAPLPGADEDHERSAAGTKGTRDAPVGAGLVVDPVQGVERRDDVEVGGKGEGGDLAQPERCGSGPALGGLDHARAGVDPDDRAAGESVGDLGGDVAVAAADVEDVFVALEMQQRQRFGSHFPLQFADLAVPRAVPVRHGDHRRRKRRVGAT